MAGSKEKGGGVHGDGVVAQSRRAKFDFELEQTFEAGMVLQGSEVKSLRNGGGNMSDAWCAIHRGEAYLHGLKIAGYTHGNQQNHPPERIRKLLLHAREIAELEAEFQRGMQLVATRIYFKGGRAKVEIAVGKPRKTHDKRHAIKDREVAADLRRATSRHRSARQRDDD